MARRLSARPARSSRRPCASWPTATSKIGPSFRGLLQRRHPRKDDLDSRPLPGFGIEVEPAAQAIGHDAVDDMQAKSGTALIAARREERVECTTPDVEAHAATIVGEDDFDIVLAGSPNLDVHLAWPAVRKGMRHRIEEQVGEHLSVRPRI